MHALHKQTRARVHFATGKLELSRGNQQKEGEEGGEERVQEAVQVWIRSGGGTARDRIGEHMWQERIRESRCRN